MAGHVNLRILLLCFSSLDDSASGFEKILVSFSSIKDELKLNGDEHVNFLNYFPSLFKKTFNNVIARTADNCNKKHSIANAIDIPIVGCPVHRLNLAVQDFLKDKDALLVS